MTERDVPDASEIDELASALVDGEATDAELARAGDPEIAARVASFEAVARLVATPVEPVDDLARTRAIRAALAAAAAADEAPATARANASRRAPAWLAPVAAAVVVLAGAGVFLAALAGSGSDGDEAAGRDAATEATALADTFGEEAGDASGSGASAGAPAPAMGSAETSTVAGDLGVFADLGELEAALRARLASIDADAADDSGPGDGAAERSALLEETGCDDGGAGEVADVVRATLASEPVVVVVRRVGGETLAYVALAEGTCEVVTSGDL